MDLAEYQKASVLIIDDEEQITNLLVAVLGGIYRCRTASSAEEALSISSWNSPKVR